MCAQQESGGAGATGTSPLGSVPDHERLLRRPGAGMQMAEMANKERIRALLKSIETGDPGPVAVVNEARYIQHNPQTEEGSEGLADLFKRLSLTSPRVNVVRVFEDGDFVFGHTEYDFSSRRIGFEVFRFEDGQAVEHWDNIQEREGPNADAHSMVSGPTEATNHEQTEANRALVRALVEEVFIAGTGTLGDSVSATYAEHDPRRAGDLASWSADLAAGGRTRYLRLHRVLAEGNFVLGVSEGVAHGKPSALYDLFRVHMGQIVEHWNTIEQIAPAQLWKNNNGKF